MEEGRKISKGDIGVGGGKKRDGMTDDEGRAGSWFHDCSSPSEASGVALSIANEICAFTLSPSNEK